MMDVLIQAQCSVDRFASIELQGEVCSLRFESALQEHAIPK